MTLAFERRFYRDKALFFNEWRGYAAWQNQCREKLHKFALFLQNRHFYSWRKAAMEQIEERKLIERAGIFWVKRTERQAWLRWVVYLDEMRAIRRAVAFLRNHRIARAFNACKSTSGTLLFSQMQVNSQLKIPMPSCSDAFFP